MAQGRAVVRRPISLPIIGFITASILIASLSIVGCDTAPVPLSNRSPARVEFPLDGAYEAAIHSDLIGSITTRFSAMPTPAGFVANTRPGVAWGFVGGIEAILGPLLAPGLFPGGAILTWESRLPHDGGSGWGRIGAGRGMNVAVATYADAHANLFYDNRLLATLTLRPAATDQPSPDRYERLCGRIEAALRQSFYDAAAVDSSAVRGYLRRLRAAAPACRDDLEFAFAAEMARRGSLPTTQMGLIRRLDSEGEQRLSRAPPFAGTLVSAYVYEGVAHLRGQWFADPAYVDRAIEPALAKNPRGLIIDLRSCRGGDLSALRVVSWVAGAPAEVGVLSTVSRTSASLQPRAAGLPRVVVSARRTTDELVAAAHSTGAFVATVEPADQPFSGPVAVLISGKTAGSAEILAAALRSTGRARLFGERTAGRPLALGRADLGDGWVLQLPMWEFRGADGSAAAAAVAPDSPINPDDADDAARAWIAQTPLDEPAVTAARTP